MERTESIGDDGQPDRKVIIQGQDSGKLWLIHQVLFELGYASDSPYLTTFQLQAATGIEVAVLPVSDFMTEVVGVVNKKVDMLAAYSSQQLKHFIPNCTVKQGQVAPGLVGQYEGSIWGLAAQFADRPWNEMFIEDREFGPVFVFRPVPFKGIDGKYIMAGAVDPGLVKIDIDAVVSMSVARADSNVANFFYVPPGDGSLTTNGYSNVSALNSGTPFDSDYANNKPELYGVKRMKVETHLMSDNLATVPSLAPVGQQQAQGQIQVEWNILRANDLKAMSRDNGVFEACELNLRGSRGLQDRALPPTDAGSDGERVLRRGGQPHLLAVRALDDVRLDDPRHRVPGAQQDRRLALLERRPEGAVFKMSLRFAQVVAVHPETRSVDLVFVDNGQPAGKVKVQSHNGSSDTGFWDIPNVPKPASQKAAGGFNGAGRNMVAVVDFLGALPIVTGFMHPSDRAWC